MVEQLLLEAGVALLLVTLSHTVGFAQSSCANIKLGVQTSERWRAVCYYAAATTAAAAAVVTAKELFLHHSQHLAPQLWPQRWRSVAGMDHCLWQVLG